MDPDTYAELLEALANGQVTFTKDVLARNGNAVPSWTTAAKIKFEETEIVDGAVSEPVIVKVRANAPWRPAIGQKMTIAGDTQTGRTFTVAKVTAKGGVIPTKFIVEARA